MSRVKEQRRALRWKSFTSTPFLPFPHEHDDSLWQKCNKLLKRQPQNVFFFLTGTDTLKKKVHTFNDIGLNYPLPAFGAIFKHYILQWSSALKRCSWCMEVNNKNTKWNSTVMSLCGSRAIISEEYSFFFFSLLWLNCTNPSELKMTLRFLFRRNFLHSSPGFWWAAPCFSVWCHRASTGLATGTRTQQDLDNSSGQWTEASAHRCAGGEAAHI